MSVRGSKLKHPVIEEEAVTYIILLDDWLFLRFIFISLRFDRFNLKYAPAGESRLREIFLKTDNVLVGQTKRYCIIGVTVPAAVWYCCSGFIKYHNLSITYVLCLLGWTIPGRVD